MRNPFSRSLAALLCLAGCAPAPREVAANAPSLRWAVYYQTKLPATDFVNEDLVVFDRRYHPDFTPLRRTDVYAYVSIGEVPGDVPEKPLLEKKGALLSHNAKWNSYVVDVTSRQWRKVILQQVADAKTKGFNGIMLDTIDSPLHWAEVHAPKRQQAMDKGAIALIRAIHHAQPDMKIILNRGFSILPGVANDINFVLAESILTQPDDSSGHFTLQPANSYAQAVTQLQQVVAFAPHLQVLTLDYWNQDDVPGILSIYAQQRANGFIPYVTTQDLHRFTPEPMLRVASSRF